MKHLISIVSACLILGHATSPAAPANEKRNGKEKPIDPRQQIFAKYDLDHNGNLDVTESETLRSAYEKDPADPSLKAFDTDTDGKMSDQEIMKIINPNGAKKPPAKPKAKAKPQAKPQANKK